MTQAFVNRTVAQMRTLVYGKVRRKTSDPLTGLSTDFLTGYIATWDAYFCDYAKWTFRRTSKLIALKTGTSLASALLTTDNSIVLSSGASADASGGRISVEQDEIDYSSASGVTLTKSAVTGAKGIDLGHSSGALVDHLVPVPSDFGRPGELWVGTAANPAAVKLTHQDYRSGYWPFYPYYTTNDGYLYFPRNLSQTRATLFYFQKALQVVDGDTLQTPRKWDNFVLYCTMAECFQTIGDTVSSDYFFKLAGVPTPSNPEPAGILQRAAAIDSEQTDSEDEMFIPKL